MRSISKGRITGSGLAAIEFQPDRNGNMSYILSYACATPAGVRVSKSLRFGTSEGENVQADPADWRDTRMVGVPVFVNGQGIPLLEGTHVSTSWEPANKEGGYIKADWTLRTP